LDIDICLAVGFIRFRCSLGFPIDEIGDIPQKFERGPSTLYTIMCMFPATWLRAPSILQRSLSAG
jgi:hypothetical protein